MTQDAVSLNKILPALAKVKSQLGAVSKKANNPFFKSKYADLNTYLDEVEPLLEENGLLLLQPVVSYSDHNVVVSRILHVESGQSVESSMKLVGDTDMQKAGSGITYARRYTLGALLSMKAEDDDGNSASGKGSTKNYVKKETTTTETTTKTAASTSSEEPKEGRTSFRDRLKNKNKETTVASTTSQSEETTEDDI